MKNKEIVNNINITLKSLKIKLILVLVQIVLLMLTIAIFGRLDLIMLPMVGCIGIALIFCRYYIKELITLRDKILILKERNNVLIRAKIETKDTGED